MGSSCFTRGNGDNLQIIRDFLEDNASVDIELTGTLCQEKCNVGPVITFGDQRYCKVDSVTLTQLLDEYVNS